VSHKSLKGTHGSNRAQNPCIRLSGGGQRLDKLGAVGEGFRSKNTELWWLYFTKWTNEYIVQIAVHCKFAVAVDDVDSGARKEAAKI
jgi:hypothetical protein